MSGLIMKYFVLKPKGSDAYARASRNAMRAYALAIQDENKELAYSLWEWVKNESVNDEFPMEVNK